LWVVEPAIQNFLKKIYIAGCRTHNVFKKNYVAGCRTRNVFKRNFVLWVTSIL